jgi:hypothetical protein
MVANKPGHQGERGISRKTIAQGMPDYSGEPVVTTRVLSTFAHEAAGALGIRHSPRPLSSLGERPSKPGRIAPRDRKSISNCDYIEIERIRPDPAT